MAATVQSTVRLPSPEAADAADAAPNGTSSARKRSPTSRSPSPERRVRRRSYSRSPPPAGPARNGVLPRDVNRSRAIERQRQMAERQREEPVELAKPLSAAEKQAAAKAEYERLLNMRSGGTYVPPARLKALQAEIGTDPQSKEYQRMAWEALKKSINGLINKVNVSNIKHIVPELFGENLVRGRGLFCRSIMKAQAASLPFTPIYAAMVAIVNTKLPQVGELLVNRLIIQFRKAFRRNDKSVCLSSTTFLAHLINQQVVHEMLAAQVLLLLLNKPTDDSVEIAVGLMKEVGQHIEEFNTQIALAVFDQFRNILHEADIDKRTQYMIEVLFQIRKDRYKDNQAVKEELDLVEEEDQITHNPGLNNQFDVQDGLNVFKFDAEWEENEEAYKKLKAEILGEGDESEDEDGSDVSSDEGEEEVQQRQVEIKDQSNTDLVNLRRTIYLTIMSSGGFEECTHKLLRVNLPPGLEHEMPSMLIECSSQERTFNKFYGLIGERLCKLNRMWVDLFEQQFMKYYETIHRLETNRLRIVAQLFGHLLASDAIGWEVLSVIHMNEEETTSSSRIFIKILFEELTQSMGMKKLQERMKADQLQSSLINIFPIDNPRNTRFSINFFTAIGMGAITEGMREYLKNMPKPTVPALPVRAASPSDRSVSSYSSYSSRSRSRSRGRSYTRSPTPEKRIRRARSYSDSRSRSRSRSYTRSRSRTPPRRRRSPSYTPSRSRSRSPAVRSRRATRSISDSRSPPPRRRSYSGSISASRSRSRSVPRRRRPTGSLSRSPPPRRRRSTNYSRSRSPPRRAAYRRRNTSSPAESRSRSRSRSRSPPRRRRNSSSPVSARGLPPPQVRNAEPKGDDMAGIHPSRRGMVEPPLRGGRGGRGEGGRRGRMRADEML